MMRFWKYHGLGNSYLVVGHALTPQQARVLCDVNHGIGSDGVLVDTSGGAHGVHILNPDGSEAEKSGNGLRIFARWLCDQRRVQRGVPFEVHTVAGAVTCIVHDDADVEVAMGRVRLAPPVTLELSERVVGHPADIGNPHCIVFRDALRKADTLALGPQIETDAHFPNRTNVQFARVLDPHTIEIDIWERGAGFTLSSGSSSCAAAAVCAALGHVQSPVTVRTRGGDLRVALSPALDATLTGPVQFVAEGWSPLT